MLVIQQGMVYKILHWNDKENPHPKNLLTGFSYGQDIVKGKAVPLQAWSGRVPGS
jgi:hypothetical protein